MSMVVDSKCQTLHAEKEIPMITKALGTINSLLIPSFVFKNL